MCGLDFAGFYAAPTQYKIYSTEDTMQVYNQTGNKSHMKHMMVGMNLNSRYACEFLVNF